jgi:hypothetical protein
MWCHFKGINKEEKKAKRSWKKKKIPGRKINTQASISIDV